MADLAELGLRIHSEEAPVAEKRLDALAASALKAEKATEALATGSGRAGGAVASMTAAVNRSGDAMAAALDNLRKTGMAESEFARQAQAAGFSVAGYEMRLARLNKEQAEAAALANRTATAIRAEGGAALAAARPIQALALATNNTAVRTVAMGRANVMAADGAGMLTRQATDVAMALAMGAGPMVIATQGAQFLGEAFHVASAGGGSLSMAIRGIWVSLSPLLAILIPVALALGAVVAAVGLFNVAIQRGAADDLTESLSLTEDQLKRLKEQGIDTSVTLADVMGAAMGEINRNVREQMAPAISFFEQSWERGLTTTIADVREFLVIIVGGFIGAYNDITRNWRMFGPVIADSVITAVNAAIKAVNGLINAAIAGLNGLILAQNTITGSQVPFIQAVTAVLEDNPFAGAARKAGEASGQAYADGFSSADRMITNAMANIREGAEERARRRILAAAGDPGRDPATRAGTEARAARTPTERLTRVPDTALLPLNAALPEMITNLQLVSTELRLIDQQAQETAQGLAEAFGAPGRALGDLLTSMTSYQSRMADINLAEQEFRLTAMQAERERAFAQIQNYGDMAGAAKGFFQEGSEGYRALQVAEQAFRLFQFAMSVQAMVTGATETAALVAQNGVKAASNTSVGASAMFASLGPLGFPAVAAMLAVLAAVGLSVAASSGGSGSGARPSTPSRVTGSVGTARAQQAQAAQSTQAAQASSSGGTQVFDMRGAVVTEQLLADVNAKVAAGEARVVKAIPKVVNRGIATNRIGKPAWG